MPAGSDREEAPAGTGRGAIWRAVKAALPWAVTAAIFVYIFRRVPAAEVARAMLLVDVRLWSAVIIINFGVYFLTDATSHWLAFNWLAARAGYLEVLWVRGATFILNLVNFLIGQGGMGYWLSRKKQVPAAEAASTIIFLIFMDLFNIFLLSALGIALMPEVGLEDLTSGEPEGHLVRLVLLVLIVLLGQAVVWVVKPQTRLLGFLFRGPFLVFDRLRGRHFLLVLAIKEVSFLFDLFGTWLAFIAFGVEVPLVQVLAYLPLIYLIGALPISVLRLGTTQAAWLYFFRGAGPDAVILAASVLWSVSMIFMRAATGAVCLPGALRDFQNKNNA